MSCKLCTAVFSRVLVYFAESFTDRLCLKLLPIESSHSSLNNADHFIIVDRNFNTFIVEISTTGCNVCFFVLDKGNAPLIIATTHELLEKLFATKSHIWITEVRPPDKPTTTKQCTCRVINLKMVCNEGRHGLIVVT